MVSMCSMLEEARKLYNSEMGIHFCHSMNVRLSRNNLRALALLLRRQDNDHKELYSQVWERPLSAVMDLGLNCSRSSVASQGRKHYVLFGRWKIKKYNKMIHT